LSVNQQLLPGASSNFDELAVRVQKRMSRGLSVNFNYQYCALCFDLRAEI
jgi:hypothetical protein